MLLFLLDTPSLPVYFLFETLKCYVIIVSEVFLRWCLPKICLPPRVMLIKTQRIDTYLFRQDGLARKRPQYPWMVDYVFAKCYPGNGF